MAQTGAQQERSTNGAQELEKENTRPLRRSAYRALIQDFSPLWFTLCMNSGILGILTHQCPYQFRGLAVISTIFYVFDLVLFVLFSTAFILRLATYKHEAYSEIISEQTDLMLCACWPIAWMTLTSLTSLICSNAYWGGHAFTLVAYVMWWVCVASSLAVIFWVNGILIQKHEAEENGIHLMIILPAVSSSTVAVTGGIVASLSYNISPRLAVPVIIVSFMMVGVGILLGMILTTYIVHGLFARGWPPPPQTATVFILVGPMGQSAAALQQLGMAANKYGDFGGYHKGTFLTANSAIQLETACILIALMLSGLGIIWVFLGIFAMVERAIKKQLSWTPTWNAIIFPTGTLTTSMSLFALEMDSPAFRVITAGLIIILAFFFFLNLGFTLWKIYKGQLLIVREDWRVKRTMEEKHKEK